MRSIAALSIALLALASVPASMSAPSYGMDASHWQYSCGHRPSDWARTPPCPDPGDSMTQEKFNCMLTLEENPSEYAIFLAQVRTGEYFVGLKQFEQMALNASITDIDLYIWEDHVNRDLAVTRRTLDTIFREEVQFGRIWLDIEDECNRWGCCSTCTTEEKAANLAYIVQLRELVEDEYHLPVGIYSGTYAFSTITGIKTGEVEDNPFADLPYWWPNYSAGGFDFGPYATAPAPLPGWPQPSMRQWRGSAQACDFVMDYNWAEDYDSFRAPPHPYCRVAGSMAEGQTVNCNTKYTTRYGDSIPGIAACYGLDAAKLANANGVEADHKYLENGAEVSLCEAGISAGPAMFLVAMGLVGGGAIATAYGTAQRRKQRRAEEELSLFQSEKSKKNKPSKPAPASEAFTATSGMTRGGGSSAGSRGSSRGSRGSGRGSSRGSSRGANKKTGSRHSVRSNRSGGSNRSKGSKGSKGATGAGLPGLGVGGLGDTPSNSAMKESRSQRANRRRSKRSQNSKSSKRSKSSRNSKRSPGKKRNSTRGK